MKSKLYFLITLVLLFIGHLHAQNTFPSSGSAGLGTTTPAASSLLEMKSTTQGLLIPRMTAVQRNAVASPATGLMIYQTNSTPGFYYYNGSFWVAVSGKGPNKNLSNLTAPTAVNVDLLPDYDNNRNIGSSTLRYGNVYTYNLKFSDNTLQTTAYIPYAAGTGISISGNSISSTLTGSQWDNCKSCYLLQHRQCRHRHSRPGDRRFGC